jgi:hypothetical protein
MKIRLLLTLCPDGDWQLGRAGNQLCCTGLNGARCHEDRKGR